MMHGLMKKLQEMQMEKRRQVAQKNATAISATISAHTGYSQRSPKPTLQVYRPPGARLADMQCKQNEVNTATDSNLVAHLQPRLDNSVVLNTTSCGPVAYSKPRLDHSEVPDVTLARQTPSSTRDEAKRTGSSPQLHRDYEQTEDREVMYDSLVKQAVSGLDMEQLERLACAICHMAAKRIEHTAPAATFCHRIALASNGAFLKVLSKSCCELFEKREELMGTLEVTTDVLRWTPYVTFVAELLVLIESSDGSGANAATVGVGEMLSGCWKKAVQSLAILLSSCFHVILRPPSLGSFDEMECLRSVVTATGKTMERIAPHLMCTLMERLRTAYLEPGTTAYMRGILLELIELRASHWQLKSSAQIYYEPSKAFQRRE